MRGRMMYWLWKIAAWTYCPPWIKGNRFQRWCYEQNDRLTEWLLWRLESLAPGSALSEYYCEEHKYNPPPYSGLSFCPFCEFPETTQMYSGKVWVCRNPRW